MNSARELLLEKAREVEPRPGALALHLGVPHGCVHGWCEGCFRTLDEIADWGMCSDAQKRAVWKLLGKGRTMKHITFDFDFISPYAYLAFEKLPQVLKGLSYEVAYRPVLFAGLLKHHGQLGPAEIAPKRAWTYRQVLWLAHAHGIPLQLPAAHLQPARAAAARAGVRQDGLVNRYVAETVFRHVARRRRGRRCAAPGALRLQLQPQRDPDSAQVKAELKANTDAAIARGLFGVELRSRRKIVLGLRRIAHAARVPGRKWLVRHGDWEGKPEAVPSPDLRGPGRRVKLLPRYAGKAAANKGAKDAQIR